MPETSKQILIKAVGLSKTFTDFWGRPKAKAVQDIDFELSEGEILGLLGPNGSGKSTTLKMLLGLLYPSSGDLSVFGMSPRNVRIKERIGYLPEESYLYKYLTAHETIDFFGSLFNIPSPERKRRADQLLDMVGLSHARNRPVGEFSKGMARRIGIAQAMVNDPDLLILDEPTSGLDPIGTREVKDLISFLRDRGKTVIVSSHLLGDVEDVCSRALILYGGKIRAEGALEKLLKVPDRSRITTPLMDRATTLKVLDILREKFQEDSFSIDNPSTSLEEYFLKVVKEARDSEDETAGVTDGGGIADYLSGDEKRTADLLEELSRSKEPEKPEEHETDEEEKEPEIDEAREYIRKIAAETEEGQETVKKDTRKRDSSDEIAEANRKLGKFVRDKNGEE